MILKLHPDDDGDELPVMFRRVWGMQLFVTSGLPIRVRLKLCGNQEHYSSGLPQNEGDKPDHRETTANAVHSPLGDRRTAEILIMLFAA